MIPYSRGEDLICLHVTRIHFFLDKIANCPVISVVLISKFIISPSVLLSNYKDNKSHVFLCSWLLHISALSLGGHFHIFAFACVVEYLMESYYLLHLIILC